MITQTRNPRKHMSASHRSRNCPEFIDFSLLSNGEINGENKNFINYIFAVLFYYSVNAINNSSGEKQISSHWNSLPLVSLLLCGFLLSPIYLSNFHLSILFTCICRPLILLSMYITFRCIIPENPQFQWTASATVPYCSRLLCAFEASCSGIFFRCAPTTHSGRPHFGQQYVNADFGQNGRSPAIALFSSSTMPAATRD